MKRVMVAVIDDDPSDTTTCAYFEDRMNHRAGCGAYMRFRVAGKPYCFTHIGRAILEQAER